MTHKKDEQDWWYPELPEGYFWRLTKARGLNHTWTIQIRQKLFGIRQILGIRKSRKVVETRASVLDTPAMGYQMILLKSRPWTAAKMHQPYLWEDAMREGQMDYFILQQVQEISKVEQWINQA